MPLPVRFAGAIGLSAVVACGSRGTVVDDLTRRTASAVEARPAPESFSTLNATVAGVARHAIVARGSTRLVFEVKVPARAIFETHVAVPEDVWPVASAGVLFRVLIQAQGAEGPVQYHARHLNPNLNRTDREWRDVRVDLSRFAGQTIRLFLNTNFTPPDPPDPGDRTAGIGLWGEAKVIVR